MTSQIPANDRGRLRRNFLGNHVLAGTLMLGVLTGVAVATFATGCRPAAKVQRSDADVPESLETVDDKTETVQDDSLSTSNAKPDSNESGPADSQEVDSVADVDIMDAKHVEAERPPADRIMLLTEAGPLLIDLRITIGGRPHGERFHAAVNDVMAIADDDSDGVVEWETLMSHPRFREGQFGNPATSTYQAQLDMIRLYDTTKNGRVDADELVRYLSSNQAGSRAMSLLTSNYRRVQNRDDSPLRRWLDVDDDLVLDEQEIANAAKRLRLLDTNDDDVLLPTDFVDSVEQDGMTMRRPRDSEYLPKVGWLVGKLEPWSDMRVAWNHFYARGRSVKIGDVGIGAMLFQNMDLDESQSLDNIEMEMLAAIEPQLEFDVRLTDIADADAASTSIEMTAMRLPTDVINAVVQHQPNRITIELPEMSLDVFVKDLIGDAQYDEQATSFFQQGDKDENDYLDEEEFAEVAPFLNTTFAATDLDDNKKIFRDEIVTTLQQRNVVQRNQLGVRADDQDDALWPTMDVNSDGRIDSRELADVVETLRTLDRNDDGRLAVHELRGAMLLGVVRGGNRRTLTPGDVTFQIPTVVRQASDSTPRWFIGMDRNHDGGISWREFPGTRDQFDDLDANDDGFVLETEATSR